MPNTDINKWTSWKLTLDASSFSFCCGEKFHCKFPNIYGSCPPGVVDTVMGTQSYDVYVYFTHLNGLVMTSLINNALPSNLTANNPHCTVSRYQYIWSSFLFFPFPIPLPSLPLSSPLLSSFRFCFDMTGVQLGSKSKSESPRMAIHVALKMLWTCNCISKIWTSHIFPCHRILLFFDFFFKFNM